MNEFRWTLAWCVRVRVFSVSNRFWVQCVHGIYIQRDIALKYACGQRQWVSLTMTWNEHDSHQFTMLSFLLILSLTGKLHSYNGTEHGTEIKYRKPAVWRYTEREYNGMCRIEAWLRLSCREIYAHKLYYAKFIEINTWKLPISRENNTRNYQPTVIAVN